MGAALGSSREVATVKRVPVDLSRVSAGLKDFQRDTVEYVFDRLYGSGADSTTRFLVADEVGLGKTLVARGLIAKTIEHLHKDVRRIDVIYVCSNSEIARQNIQRLNVTGKDDFVLASRITLLPRVLHQLTRNRLNFVSFTPGTSLDLKSSGGIARERALLHRAAQGRLGRGPAPERRRPPRLSGRSGDGHEVPAVIRDAAQSPARPEARTELRDARSSSTTGALGSDGEPGFREQFDDLRERFRGRGSSGPGIDIAARTVSSARSATSSLVSASARSSRT